jgi:hypothetical protein
MSLRPPEIENCCFSKLVNRDGLTGIKEEMSTPLKISKPDPIE